MFRSENNFIYDILTFILHLKKSRYQKEFKKLKQIVSAILNMVKVKKLT